MKKLYFIVLLGVLLVSLSSADEGDAEKPVSRAGNLAGEPGRGVEKINTSAEQLKGARKAPEDKRQEDGSPFSFEVIRKAEKVFIPPLQYIKAGDEVRLAYRAYIPEEISAVLVFYHGAGAHSGLTYPHIGDGLSRHFNIAVYTPDMRGHGFSGGERGDAPSSEQVLDDVATFIRFVRARHPGKALFLGGHSAGCGLVLNYSDIKKPERVEGYVFLSPYLGFRSKTDRENNTHPFATAREEVFVKHAIDGREGHTEAVFYHYPEEVLEANPEMVTAITVNLSNAVTPSSPWMQLLSLKAPLAMWIGENDEAFDPDKVVSYIKSGKPDSELTILEDETHLSVILNASRYIGPWIQSVSGL
ncbi:MAG: alpha/beta fold hydrolase [Candidatus Auribacterota bacterium]|nr:alpha/beta fold hydrolase [Candidatus Auribacterota bacterium]